MMRDLDSLQSDEQTNTSAGTRQITFSCLLQDPRSEVKSLEVLVQDSLLLFFDDVAAIKRLEALIRHYLTCDPSRSQREFRFCNQDYHKTNTYIIFTHSHLQL